jgi:PKD repeat protein
MIGSGVSVAVSAGNSGADACDYSPARVGDAMTIGATTSSDAKASWSNYGRCLDWFAPGSSIVSAAIISDTAATTKSGTSMAAPHAAGVAALYLESDSGASPAEVAEAIYGATTRGIVTSASTTNNHLLYSGFITKVGGSTPVPTAAFVGTPTLGTSPLSVTFTDQSTNSPTTWSWDFGDGTSSTDQHPIHTYAAGTYTVRLTASNSAGSDTETKIDFISVSSPTSGGISLSVAAYKVKGVQKADLGWGGATSTSVDVWRNGTRIMTTANDGVYTDPINNKGGGSYTYKVCESGTSTCSTEVTVSY